MRLYSFLAFVFLLAAPSAIYAGGFGNDLGYVVDTPDSKINWGRGLISASAEILPMQDTIDPMRTKALAVRQSGIKARKNLLDSILGLSLSSRETVEQVFSDDIKTATMLRGLVQNSLLRTEDTLDGKVKVTASMNIMGELASIIIPPTLPFLSGIAPMLSEGRGEAVVQAPLFTDENGVEASYSGVVIDARGLTLTPILLPVIYDGKGVGVYGPFIVSRESVIKNGLVSYVVGSSIGNFRERVGNSPLVVKPVSSHGTVRGNLILTLEESAKFRAALKRKSVIDNCAVVIMMDVPAGEGSVQISNDNGTVGIGLVPVKNDSPVKDSRLQEETIVDEGASPALQQ
ncbi:hypothetical protein SAMN05660337_2187 [Maridesulfovibrio ferrireducens]|uniref:LPP20 lipoprotein n=1 Tax=Maridesulfovibrio ferrireducens TaxID=246191 RepID=A0A1G9HIU6_9BACT|nr:hypothetical protein [Maridesulfovibrio ferrireducens]SDL12877.1 hypothetical protein SAMN05660337_2187 [Maridesulfovibrio ferrireducens]